MNLTEVLSDMDKARGKLISSLKGAGIDDRYLDRIRFHEKKLRKDLEKRINRSLDPNTKITLKDMRSIIDAMSPPTASG